jgi:hypothetical protein
MENQEAIKAFLEKHQDLFWHFDKSKLEALSIDVVVEYILNYGDESSIKELFEVYGLEEIASVFFKNTNEGRRINYLPEVKNYFTLYFNRHAPRNFK